MKNLLASTALLAVLTAHGAVIPNATGTALDGHTITLPRDLPARANILILGFTHSSVGTTTAWEKPIRASLASTPGIGYYDMPFLEDAPSLIRPLILHSIRKQVPAIVKPHFVPLTSGESAWKRITGFSSADSGAAYVLLVDRSGNIRWQTHQPFSQTRFNELAAAAHQLAAATK